jgi:hypothetical protein
MGLQGLSGQWKPEEPSSPEHGPAISGQRLQRETERIEHVWVERSKRPVRQVRTRLRGPGDVDEVLTIALDGAGPEGPSLDRWASPQQQRGAASLLPQARPPSPSPERRVGGGPAVRMVERRFHPKAAAVAPLVGEPGRTKPFVECLVDLFIEPGPEATERVYRVAWRVESGGSQLLGGEFTLLQAVRQAPKTLRVAAAWVITSELERRGVPRLAARVTGELGGWLLEVAVVRPLATPLKAAAEVIEVTSAVLPRGDAGDWVGRDVAPGVFRSLLLEELGFDPDGRRSAATPSPGERGSVAMVTPPYERLVNDPGLNEVDGLPRGRTIAKDGKPPAPSRGVPSMFPPRWRPIQTPGVDGTPSRRRDAKGHGRSLR